MEDFAQISKQRWTSGFIGLSAALMAVLCANIFLGSVKIDFSQALHIIMSGDDASTLGTILWRIRIPRALASAMGGAYLAIAGLLLQVYFRNPVVGPYILGISSGATLMVSVVMLTSLQLGLTQIAPYLTTLAAFAGAYGAMMLVLAAAAKIRQGVTLLILGLMIGYLCHAVTSILVAFAEKEQVKGFVLWQLGSFSGFHQSEIYILFFGGGAVAFGVYLLSKPLNAFLLGEEYAASMGVNIRLFRILILLAACALAGMVTGMAGPVAFIGLAVPHMARLVFRTSDNNVLAPGAALLGAVVTGVCDLLARLLFSPVELPISAITAFFGAPIVIGLLLRRRVVS